MPNRIVSLVPSITETLFDLGVGDRVVGITKFCVHPQHWKNKKTIVGGTKNPQIERIRELNPDWVFSVKEENRKEDIEQIRQFAPVSVYDIETYDQALDSLTDVARICGKADEGAGFAEEIKTAFENPGLKTMQSVAYIIWKNPIMVAAAKTFVHDLLGLAGFSNVFAGKTRYPQTDYEELNRLSPDLVFLSSEPYPFSGKHLPDWQQAMPRSRILLVEGEMFSWYGTRMLKAAKYFEALRQNLQ